jgi:hypothetical protein
MDVERAFVMLQFKVELPPGLMLPGMAEKLLIVGGPGMAGLEGDEAEPVPIAFVAVTVKV